MRILFASSNKYIPELRGGMEVNTHQLAQALIGHQDEVGVLSGLAGIGATGWSARLRIKLGAVAARDQGLGYPVWRGWDVIAALDKVVDEFRPEVIVVQGGADFDGLVRACLRFGLPVVCYLHTPDLLPLPDDIAAASDLYFVANSRFTASLHPDKTIGAIFRPLIGRDTYEVATDRSSALFINPVDYKGLDIVLALAEARPDVPFLFVRNRAAAVTSWPRRDNIALIGPFDDMRRAYARGRILLAPSQWLETWGRVASEAHFSAIPVLASDRGGLKEAVGPGGLCLPADAPLSEWLEAFATLWDDDESYRRFSAQAAAYAIRPEIDPARIVPAFRAYLQERL